MSLTEKIANNNNYINEQKDEELADEDLFINNIIPIYIFGKNYHHLFIRNLPYKNRIYVRKTIDK